ncbi:MAG TPA: hypothetical protein VMX36_07745 [Sedimentisphaerales bacterium]|nr:hypothetical protein [Sedimentisphaerales bacterium]
MTEITILAVSRISDGVCVAGITNEGQWIRPTRPNSDDSWRQLELEDCRDLSGNWIIRKGNRVKFDLVESIPKGNHSEDWRIGSRRTRLVHELTEEEYFEFCQKHQERSLKSLEQITDMRSLILIRPERFTSFTFRIETSRKGKRSYVPRCGFVFNGRLHLSKPISDAEWRGYGRKYLHTKQGPTVKNIFDENKTENYWLTIGLNIVDSTVYLMVVDVHLFPIRHFDMDFKRLL